jgi:hypothetical protein
LIGLATSGIKEPPYLKRTLSVERKRLWSLREKNNFANVNTVLYLYTILDDVKAQSMPNNMNEGFCSKKITSFIS